MHCNGGDASGPHGGTQSADLCHWGSIKMGEVWHVVSLPMPHGCEEVGGAGKPTPLPGEHGGVESVNRGGSA